MVLLRSALGAMLLAPPVLLAPPKAVAGEGEITFCNEFPHKVYVAIAYPQADAPDVVWYLARGWMHIETGKCFVFDTALRVRTFYYHAMSEPYKEGKKKSYGNGAPTSSSPCARPIFISTTPRRNSPECILPSFPRDPYRLAGR